MYKSHRLKISHQFPLTRFAATAPSNDRVKNPYRVTDHFNFSGINTSKAVSKRFREFQ